MQTLRLTDPGIAGATPILNDPDALYVLVSGAYARKALSRLEASLESNGRQFMTVSLRGIGHEQDVRNTVGFEDWVADVVKAIQRRTPGQKVHIVAHSMGGFVALLAAEQVQVDSITLLNPPFKLRSVLIEVFSHLPYRLQNFSAACFHRFGGAWARKLPLIKFGANIVVQGARVRDACVALERKSTAHVALWETEGDRMSAPVPNALRVSLGVQTHELHDGGHWCLPKQPDILPFGLQAEIEAA